jgi:methylated-DNA-[protein]-cysteine S-methyltransferase
VGAALGRNPFLVIVPCHRVVAGNGTLGGFRAGLKVKKWLLEHEGAIAERPRSFKYTFHKTFKLD